MGKQLRLPHQHIFVLLPVRYRLRAICRHEVTVVIVRKLLVREAVARTGPCLLLHCTVVLYAVSLLVVVQNAHHVLTMR